MVAEHDAELVIPGRVDIRTSGLAGHSNGHDAAVVDVGCVSFIASADVTGASRTAEGGPEGRRPDGPGNSR